MAPDNNIPRGVPFTKGGPEIPQDLLNELEAGNVVVFCGAGISQQCGLPGFKGLVEKIHTKLGQELAQDELELSKKGEYDAVLGLIESRIGASPVRNALKEVLKIEEGADLETHKSLLKLATSKNRVRLVTTNFDDAFEKISEGSPDSSFDYAPYLPLPNRDWNSVVNLHGGLRNSKDKDGRTLVVTSADFGRAYITEGWASRFLVELFRRTSAIFFVGYSGSDHAIRYAVDAFAAERKAEELDENPGEQKLKSVATAYILTDSKEESWKSRGITPIIYDNADDDHKILHETLRNLASLYTMGGFDRARIIAQHAGNGLDPRLDEESKSQIIWALRDPHGAHCFSKLDPAPHLGWLEVLSKEGLLNGTVYRWRYSVPGTLSSSTKALVDWLCKYLDKPELINWVIKNGSLLHPEFRATVQRKLLDAQSPALPIGTQKFWRFISPENAPIYNPHFHYEYFHQWPDLEKRNWDHLTAGLVISWVAPTIRFSEHSRWRGYEEVDPDTLKTFASLELVPALGNSSHEFASKLMGLTHADEIAKDLLSPLSDSIHKGLSDLKFLGDPLHSTIGRHSIDNGSGNWETQTWTAYVVLLRDCWTRVDPERAHTEVTRWSRWPFSFFRRFVLWSSGKPGGFSATESVEYLGKQIAADPEWYYDIGEELTQYLRRIASSLSPENAERLVEQMLASHASQYPAESAENFSKRIERIHYSRLNALRKGGLGLPLAAKIRLDEILRLHPEWNQSTVQDLAEGDVSEGAMWGDSNDNDPALNVYLGWDDDKVFAEIMAESASAQIRQRWRCLRSKDPNRAIRLLKRLGKAEYFEPTIWSEALNNLRQDSISSEYLKVFGDYVDLLGGQFLSDNLAQLASLLTIYCEEKHQDQDSDFWKLWDAIYGLAIGATVEDLKDPIDTAYNSPIGKLTRALVLKIGEAKPQKWDEVNNADQDRLVKLLEGRSNGHRLSRMILAIYTRWLHWLLPANASGPFLASFDRDVSDEAKNLWLGYLMSPNISPDLWSILQRSFEKMLSHSNELGERQDQFFSFFAYILLNPKFQIDPLKARSLLKSGSAKCRSQVASYWRQQVFSGTDYGEKIYKEQLKYLLTDVWPLERDRRDEESAESLAGIAVECGAAFPDAFNTVSTFLVKLRDPASLLYRLKEKEIAHKYPQEVLELVYSVVDAGSQPAWYVEQLKGILLQIVKTSPDLKNGLKYIELDKHVNS